MAGVRRTGRRAFVEMRIGGIVRKTAMNRRLMWAVFMGFACLTSSCAPVGQRLLHIDIEVDGQVAYSGIRGVPDSTPVEKMWNVLEDVPFDPPSDSIDATTKPGKTSQTLTGGIVVRIKHTDRELASASLESVTVNWDQETSHWYLSETESDRVRKAANPN